MRRIAFLLVALNILLPTIVNGYTETIIINENGVTGTDKIQRDGNLFTFTSDIEQPIVIDVDNIILDGKGHTLNVLSSYDAILIEEQEGITIKNVRITDGKTGINVLNSSQCVFTNNTITGMGIEGIKIRGTLIDIEISNNLIEENTREGISIRGKSAYIQIYENTINRNDRVGILLETSNYSKVYRNNIIDQEEIGIMLINTYQCTAYRNHIEGNRQGVYLDYDCKENGIYENKIFKNEENGIEFNDSPYNLIYSNIIESNGENGIDFENSSNNTIYQNDINSNQKGINFDPDSSGNIVYNNNIDNPIMVTYFKYSTHTWSLEPPIGGNYWSDYTGSDTDNNGYGDTPHILYRDTFGNPDTLNVDNYPLMQPYIRSSQISQSISVDNPYLGDEVVIDIKLSPATLSIELILDITPPVGATIHETVITDYTGLCSYSFTPDRPSQWKVTTSWIGDEFYAGSQTTQQTITVEEPQIEVQVSPNVIVLEDSVTITGQTEPPRDGETIRLEITGPVTETRNLVTSNGGRYSYTFTPGTLGIYDVEVNWNTASATDSFTVNEPELEPEPEPEPEDTEQDGGIPLPATYIIIGLVFSILLRYRKTVNQVL